MDIAVASLILRQATALASEGIGPDEAATGDDDLIAEAFQVAGHLIDPAFLWWIDQKSN